MSWFKSIKLSEVLRALDFRDFPAAPSVSSSCELFESLLGEFINGVVPVSKSKAWDGLDAAWPEDDQES